MKLKNNFWFVCVFSFVSGQVWGAGLPNGLCVLRGEQGNIGNGFVVGDRLFSAAHVLAQKDAGTWFCIQRGKFQEVPTQGRVYNHRRFRNAEAELVGVDPDSISGSWSNLEALAENLYDIAHVKLAEPLASDFTLDPSDNISETWDRLENSAATVAYFDAEGNGHVTDVPNVLPMGLEFVAGSDPVSLFSHENGTHRVTLFLDHEHPELLGHSGAPLYQRRRGQKLMVSGVLSARLPELLTVGSGKTPAVFASVQLHDFSKLNCPDDVAKLARRPKAKSR